MPYARSICHLNCPFGQSLLMRRDEWHNNCGIAFCPICSFIGALRKLPPHLLVSGSRVPYVYYYPSYTGLKRLGVIEGGRGDVSFASPHLETSSAILAGSPWWADGSCNRLRLLLSGLALWALGLREKPSIQLVNQYLLDWLDKNFFLPSPSHLLAFSAASYPPLWSERPFSLLDPSTRQAVGRPYLVFSPSNTSCDSSPSNFVGTS